jgi:hypothetical protein
VTHRINVNFSDVAYTTLKTLARDQGKSMSEVLRDAIALEKWFQGVHSRGGRVLVERHGRTQEVIPR